MKRKNDVLLALPKANLGATDAGARAIRATVAQPTVNMNKEDDLRIPWPLAGQRKREQTQRNAVLTAGCIQLGEKGEKTR